MCMFRSTRSRSICLIQVAPFSPFGPLWFASFFLLFVNLTFTLTNPTKEELFIIYFNQIHLVFMLPPLESWVVTIQHITSFNLQGLLVNVKNGRPWNGSCFAWKPFWPFFKHFWNCPSLQLIRFFILPHDEEKYYNKKYEVFCSYLFIFWWFMSLTLNLITGKTNTFQDLMYVCVCVLCFFVYYSWF